MDTRMGKGAVAVAASLCLLITVPALAQSDRTGSEVLTLRLGTFEGECNVITPAEDMKAVTGVNCSAGGKGVELHAVVTRPDIVVLKLAVEVGVTPDPMARIEIKRVTAPSGASIEATP